MLDDVCDFDDHSEELLIQRGVEIGLVRSERGVRAAIASAMIDSILAEVASAQPADVELLAFYAENSGYFARPSRIRLQRIYFASGDDASERARRAHAALLSGEDFASVRARLGDEEISPVPDALLPSAKLRDYVGPGLVQVAQQLGAGEFSEPVQTPGGRYIVHLVDFEAARARASVGEISGALEGVFTRYRAEVRSVSGVYSSVYEGDEEFESVRKEVEACTEFRKGGLTASAGVAGFSWGMAEERQLIDAATQALYAAKGAGRNRVMVRANDIDDAPQTPSERTARFGRTVPIAIPGPDEGAWGDPQGV